MDDDNGQGAVRFIIDGVHLGTQGSPRRRDGRFDISEVHPYLLQDDPLGDRAAR